MFVTEFAALCGLLCFECTTPIPDQIMRYDDLRGFISQLERRGEPQSGLPFRWIPTSR